jgi:hypothetical protein
MHEGPPDSWDTDCSWVHTVADWFNSHAMIQAAAGSSRRPRTAQQCSDQIPQPERNYRDERILQGGNKLTSPSHTHAQTPHTLPSLSLEIYHGGKYEALLRGHHNIADLHWHVRDIEGCFQPGDEHLHLHLLSPDSWLSHLVAYSSSTKVQSISLYILYMLYIYCLVLLRNIDLLDYICRKNPQGPIMSSRVLFKLFLCALIGYALIFNLQSLTYCYKTRNDRWYTHAISRV